MNETRLGIDAGTLAAVYLALLLFGNFFNLVTEIAQKKGYMKGYTSLFVAGGVAVTVMATAVISLEFALVTAGAFMASGLPMIVGSMWRHMRERDGEMQRLRQELLRGDVRDGDAG